MPNTHTAGPWHIVPYGDGDSLVICLDEAGDKRVAFMAVPGQRDQQERRKTWKRIKANARLIAAAPELLEALKDARTTISITRTNVLTEIGRCADPSESMWAGVPEQLAKRIEHIDAAIAKAEG